MSKSTTQISRTSEATADSANASHSLIARSGLASGTLSQLTSGPGDWATAKKWIGEAEKLDLCKHACLLMCGFELIALQKEHGIQRGGDRRSNRQTGGLKFADLLQEHLNLSLRTAERLTERARNVAGALAKSPELNGLDLLETPPSKLTPEQYKGLLNVFKERLDVRTEGELMQRLGICKKPAALVAGTDTDKMTAAERAASIARGARETAENIISRLHIHFLEPGEDILHLDDDLLGRLLGVCTDVNHRIRALTKGRRKKKVRTTKVKGATK